MTRELYDRFNMANYSRQDILFRFRQVILDIARDLEIEELEQAKYLCTDFLPLGRREMITSTVQLFEELEKQQRVGIDNWSLVKDLLLSLHRFDLLEKVDQFDLDRNLRLVTLKSQLGQHTEIGQHGTTSTNGLNIDHEPDSNNNAFLSQKSPGKVTIKCALELAAKGAWVAGSAYIFKRYINEPEELIRLVSAVVVPTGLLVKSICRGSVNIVLQATDLHALRELWQRCHDGRLKKQLEEVFVTEELKKLSQGEEIIVSVHIQEQEYRTACLDLMFAHVKENKLDTSLHALPRRSSCPGFPVQGTRTDDLQFRAMQVVAWHERQRNTLLTRELQRSQPNTPTLESRNVKRGTKLKSILARDDQTKKKEEEDEDDRVVDRLSERECHELCILLDPTVPFGNDWKMLASDLDFKMGEIRLLEQAASPTKDLLKLAITKYATLTVSELVSSLGRIGRNDAVKLLRMKGDRSASPRKEILLSDVPYSVRWKLAYHLEYPNRDLFYNIVERCDNSLEYIDVMHLSKAKSPTIALLDHLDAKFPNFTAAHLRKIFNEVGAHALDEILETFLKSECNKNAETVLGRSSFKSPRISRLRIEDWGGQWSRSVDSGLDVDTCTSPTSSSVEIEYEVYK